MVGSQTRVLLFPSSAEILQANDLLTQGVLLYKQVMEGRVNAGSKTPRPVGNVPVPRGTCRACPRPLPACSLPILEKNGSSERSGSRCRNARMCPPLFPESWSCQPACQELPPEPSAGCIPALAVTGGGGYGAPRVTVLVMSAPLRELEAKHAPQGFLVPHQPPQTLLEYWLKRRFSGPRLYLLLQDFEAGPGGLCFSPASPEAFKGL